MPPATRILEAVLYSWVNLFPYLVLALYPFTERLRFSKRTTALLILLMGILQSGFGICAIVVTHTGATILSLVSTVTYAIFYFVAVKEQIGKLLFMLLVVSNFSNLVVMAAKCTEGIVFPQLAVQDNRWSFALFSLCYQLLFFPFFLWFFKRFLKDAFISRASTVWRYLWLIPLTFYLFWYQNTYFGTLSSLEMALQPINSFFTLLINAGALLVYRVVARSLYESEQNLQLRTKNHQLAIQNLQYELLQERMEDTRRARHDLRQHLSVLSSLAQEEKWESLKDYLNHYLKTASSTASIRPSTL